MKTDYINLKIRIYEENHDIAMAVLQDYDFCGIEENLDDVIVTFTEDYFKQIDIDELLECLKKYAPESLIVSTEKIGDKNWNEEWEKHIEPVFVSDRITITPTHKLKEISSEIKIIIDPKMSFGTGHHTTTRLMCKLMDGLVNPNSKWIDVGTGTGVLAILAIILGAESVYAFDNNEWSIDNAKENIAKNNVESKINLELADIDSADLSDCDGIAANIFLNLAVPSLPKFRNAIEKSNGDILISGIMIYDEKILIEEAIKNNLELVNKIYEDEWVAFHFRKQN